MNQNPHSPHRPGAPAPSSQPASSCWPATSVRPATFCRPALRPLAALLLGTALLGNAQAGDPIKWQKPGWDFLPRISLEYDRLKNRDLRGSGERTKSDTVPEFRLVSRYQHDSRWGFVGDFELYESIERETGSPTDRQTRLEVTQLFAEAQLQEYGARARLGRWSIDDERTWFFDTQFDGLNATLDYGPYQLDTFVARYSNWRSDLFNRHTKHEKGADVVGALGTWWMTEDHKIILKGLHQEEDNDDLRLTHVAGGSLNEGDPHLQHWAMASYVSGKEKGRRVRGEAIDLGATLFLDDRSGWSPRATLGYAWGSGDDGEGVDTSHHQTGWQSNKSYMGAEIDFKTYGTVLDPQLSNIHVLTAGVGITPMKKSSLDLVFHHYRQDKTTELTRTDLRPRADLQDRRTLGNGIDLVWGWKPTKEWKIQAYTGMFMPSGRFRASSRDGAGKSSNAWAAGFEVKYYPGRK